MLFTERHELGGMFVIRTQRQIHCGFIYHGVHEKLSKSGEIAAANESGGFEFRGAAPIIIDEPHDFIAQFGMLRYLVCEIDGTIVGAHDQDESPVPSTTAQGQKKPTRCKTASNHSSGAKRPKNDNEGRGAEMNLENPDQNS